MATIENKVFKTLLNSHLIEREAPGEYHLFHAEDDTFYFRYNVKTDALEGSYELSEGQSEQVKNLCYEFHQESQPEEEDNSFAEFPLFI